MYSKYVHYFLKNKLKIKIFLEFIKLFLNFFYKFSRNSLKNITFSTNFLKIVYSKFYINLLKVLAIIFHNILQIFLKFSKYLLKIFYKFSQNF